MFKRIFLSILIVLFSLPVPIFDISGYSIISIAEASYRNTPKELIIVNKPTDLPAPADWGDGLGTVYRLKAKKYLIGANISLDYPIVATITPATTTTIHGLNTKITFTMASGGAFVSNSTTNIGYLLFWDLFVEVQPGASLFDIDGAGQVLFDASVFSGTGSIGTMKNVGVFTSRDTLWENFSGGLKLENATIAYFRGSAMNPLQVIGDALIEVKGTFLSNVFTDTQSIPIAGDSAFNIDPGIASTSRIEMNTFRTVIAAGGIPFKSGSLDQTDPRISVHACPNIPNSQIIGSMYMERNTTVTTITDTGTTGDIDSFTDGETTGSITAFADAGGGLVTVTSSASTGLTTGDTVIMTGTTNYNDTFVIANAAGVDYDITHSWDGDDATGTWVNYKTIVTSISHGKNDGDIAWIINDDYAGKYTITNALTDTFDIPVLYAGAATGKWEDYWVKVAGTTLPMENERASMTDNNEITFTNLERQSVTITATLNMKREVPGVDRTFEFAIMKNDERLKGSVKARELKDKQSLGTITCTTSVIAGDILVPHTRNIEDTSNIIMTNISTIAK